MAVVAVVLWTSLLPTWLVTTFLPPYYCFLFPPLFLLSFQLNRDKASPPSVSQQAQASERDEGDHRRSQRQRRQRSASPTVAIRIDHPEVAIPVAAVAAAPVPNSGVVDAHVAGLRGVVPAKRREGSKSTSQGRPKLWTTRVTHVLRRCEVDVSCKSTLKCRWSWDLPPLSRANKNSIPEERGLRDRDRSNGGKGLRFFFLSPDVPSAIEMRWGLTTWTNRRSSFRLARSVKGHCGRIRIIQLASSRCCSKGHYWDLLER